MELVIKEAIDMFYVKEFERLTGYVREKDERIWQLIQQNREQDIELALLRKVAKAAKGVCALCPVRDTCVPNDCWVWPIKVALKEGER